MASQQLVVVVHNGADRVDGPFSRPVRLLPDGTAGVVYGGDVYPLYDDDRIDLRDEPVDKWSCPSFVTAGTAVPYARRRAPKGRRGPRVGAWYLESNRFGHYLAFDAGEAVAASVAELMTDCGLGVRRWDVSHRPSEDGVQYDWFIRLAFEGDRDECLQRVSAALSRTAGTKKKDTPAARDSSELAELRELVTDLASSAQEAERQRVAALQQAADSALRTADAEAELRLAQAARKDATRRLTAARKADKQLRDELLASRQEVADAQLTRTAPTAAVGADAQVAGLTAELAAVRDSLSGANAAWFEAQTRSESLDDEAAALRERLGDAERERTSLAEQLAVAAQQAQEVAAQDREAATAAAARSPRRRESVEGFLLKCLPRLQLDPDSVETLLSFPKPLEALRLLVRLQERDSSVQATRLHSGFFEVVQHVHTGEAGNAAMGRVYYGLDAEGQVHVRLHRKRDLKEQQRFIKNLRLAA